MGKRYICSVCDGAYRVKALKNACETRPKEKSFMEVGTVFRYGVIEECPFGIILDTKIEEQTHRIVYEIIMTGICLPTDEEWSVSVPGSVYKNYLRKAQPVSEEDFQKVKATIDFVVGESSTVRLEYVSDALKKLDLVPFWG